VRFVGNSVLFGAVKEFWQIDQELTKSRQRLGWHPFYDSQCRISCCYCTGASSIGSSWWCVIFSWCLWQSGTGGHQGWASGKNAALEEDWEDLWL